MNDFAANRARLVLVLCCCFSVSTIFADNKKWSIDEAVSTAIRNSHLVKSAQAKSRSAATRIDASFAGFYPTLDADFYAGTNRMSDAARNGNAIASSMDDTSSQMSQELRDHNEYRAGVQLRQSLFAGMSSINEAKATKLAHTISVIDTDKFILQIRRETIDHYFRIKVLELSLNAEKEVKTQLSAYLAEAKALMQQGRTTRLDVIKAQSALLAQDPVIYDLESDLEKRQTELQRLLGISLGSDLILTDTLESAFLGAIKIPLPKIEVAVDKVLQLNHSIRRAKIDVDRLDRAASSAESRHYPRLDFVAGAKSLASNREDFMGETSQQYSFGLELKIPLFSGLTSYADATAKISEKQAAEESLLLEQERALTDLKAIYRDWESCRLKIGAQEESLALAEEAFRLARLQFGAGTAKATDVVDAFADKLKSIRGIGELKHQQIMLRTKFQDLLGAINDSGMDK